MEKNFLIRGFPDDLHRDAKALAALQGITLKELFHRAVAEYVHKYVGEVERGHNKKEG